MEKWQQQLIRKLFHYSRARLDPEAAFQIKDRHLPSKLYKYRSFTDSHKDALEAGVLWVSSPNKLNDPYEAAVTLDPNRFFVEDQSDAELSAAMKKKLEAGTLFDLEPLRNPVELRDIWRRNAEATLGNCYGDRTEKIIEIFATINTERNLKIVKELSDGFRRSLSILSLSEEPASDLMWSHYSSSHTGFLIEYDMNSLLPSDIRRRFCFPVFYTHKIRDITRYIRKIDRSDLNNIFAHYICLIKKADWQYEKEWRFIQAIGPDQANFKLSMPTPSAIVLGSCVSDEDASWMADFCRSRSIPMKRATQTAGRFGLIIKDATA